MSGLDLESQLRKKQETLSTLKVQHLDLEKQLRQLCSEAAIVLDQDKIASVKRDWQLCHEAFESFSEKNKNTVDQLTELTQLYNKSQILYKYLQIGKVLQQCTNTINSLLLKERAYWNNYQQKRDMVQFEAWFAASRPIFLELESNLRRVAHIKSVFQKITEKEQKDLNLITFANDKHSLFVNEFRELFFERLKVATELFEWPKENHELGNHMLASLRLSNQLNDNNPINSIMPPFLQIQQMDDRLHLFVALFIFGLNIQKALYHNFSVPLQTVLDDQNVWVLESLFQPITLRFKYHFMSAESKTNQLDKPEWYFTYIANLISNHAEFLLIYIQPLLNSQSLINLDAKQYFMKTLVEVLQQKLIQDIPVLLKTNQPQYCHTLTECVAFNEILYNVHNYNNSFPSPVEAFAHTPAYFKAWLAVEVFCINNNTQLVGSGKEMLKLHYSTLSDIDEFKPTTSAESIIVTVSAITQTFFHNVVHELIIIICCEERYKRLKNMDYKLEFYEKTQEKILLSYVNVLNEIFNGLRTAKRISLDTLMYFCRLCNSANYCLLILHDWSENIIFLEMQLEIERSESGDDSLQLEQVTGGLFQLPIGKFNKFLSYVLETLCSIICDSFIDGTDTYFRNSHKTASNTLAYDISPELCAPLFGLKQNLKLVLTELASTLQTKFWETFTVELDTKLSKKILENRNFSPNGAEQLRFNVKVLFSFITPHYSPPSPICPRLKEILLVLVMEKHDLIQLRDDLQYQNAAEQRRILKEYRIQTLSGRETDLLIAQRSDLRD